MQTYCRESAPLVPHEWSYEAENLQLYRYRQVTCAHVKIFTLGGLRGALMKIWDPPNIPKSTRARMLKLKTQLDIVTYSPRVQKKFC